MAASLDSSPIFPTVQREEELPDIRHLLARELRASLGLSPTLEDPIVLSDLAQAVIRYA
jgi:hypothetical protein